MNTIETMKERHSVRQYADRLSSMIDDLFEVSKINSGTIQLEYSELNIVALIEQTQAECVDLLEKKNLKVISHESSRNIILNLDGNKTYRIFENIFTNIGKYAMPNSRVYLNIEEYTDRVEIDIKNVSEMQMDFSAEEIVERFIRGDKSRHEGGSGLGLSIIKSFVEVQKGKFFLDIDGDLFKTKIIFYK
ncbi:MAG: ATP-binding protein [Erysipelotrichaceae bacterium]|nr:ATP-binding protein [Erysipelotrichaceae bacterium]